jgi:hypothetical protein
MRSIDWKGKSKYEKILYCVTLPITIAFNFTIPRVELDDYNRMFLVISPMVSPILAMWAFGCMCCASYYLCVCVCVDGLDDTNHVIWTLFRVVSVLGVSFFDGVLPLWVIVFWCGVGLSFVVLATTKNKSLPRYNYVCCLLRIATYSLLTECYANSLLYSGVSACR